MEVHFTPELQAKLTETAKAAGREPDDLVQDVIAGCLEELSRVRSMLDRRYDEVKAGRVTPIDGNAFFEDLRRREAELLQHRSPR